MVLMHLKEMAEQKILAHLCRYPFNDYAAKVICISYFLIIFAPEFYGTEQT